MQKHATPIKAAIAAVLITYSAISAAAVDVGRFIDEPLCDLKPWNFQCERWESPRRCWPDRLFPFPHPYCWPQSVLA